MKLVSWNVNGIRACLQKGFLDSFHQLDADIFCVQETKMQSGQADLKIEGYHYYLNSAVKKGYRGTLIYSKEKPLNVFYGMNKEEHDQEGRLITLEFENYYVITCYTPNHQEIDLKNPKSNRKNAGFSDEEREKMTQLLNHGFIDTYRYLYPLQEGVYSWWSYRFKAREKNAGWRIDYFIVSDSLKDKIIDATIETEIMGSDHCPVTLTIDL